MTLTALSEFQEVQDLTFNEPKTNWMVLCQQRNESTHVSHRYIHSHFVWLSGHLQIEVLATLAPSVTCFTPKQSCVCIVLYLIFWAWACQPSVSVCGLEIQIDRYIYTATDIVTNSEFQIHWCTQQTNPISIYRFFYLPTFTLTWVCPALFICLLATKTSTKIGQSSVGQSVIDLTALTILVKYCKSFNNLLHSSKSQLTFHIFAKLAFKKNAQQLGLTLNLGNKTEPSL